MNKIIKLMTNGLSSSAAAAAAMGALEPVGAELHAPLDAAAEKTSNFIVQFFQAVLNFFKYRQFRSNEKEAFFLWAEKSLAGRVEDFTKLVGKMCETGVPTGTQNTQALLLAQEIYQACRVFKAAHKAFNKTETEIQIDTTQDPDLLGYLLGQETRKTLNKTIKSAAQTSKTRTQTQNQLQDLMLVAMRADVHLTLNPRPYEELVKGTAKDAQMGERSFTLALGALKRGQEPKIGSDRAKNAVTLVEKADALTVKYVKETEKAAYRAEAAACRAEVAAYRVAAADRRGQADLPFYRAAMEAALGAYSAAADAARDAINASNRAIGTEVFFGTELEDIAKAAVERTLAARDGAEAALSRIASHGNYSDASTPEISEEAADLRREWINNLAMRIATIRCNEKRALEKVVIADGRVAVAQERATGALNSEGEREFSVAASREWAEANCQTGVALHRAREKISKEIEARHRNYAEKGSQDIGDVASPYWIAFKEAKETSEFLHYRLKRAESRAEESFLVLSPEDFLQRAAECEEAKMLAIEEFEAAKKETAELEAALNLVREQEGEEKAQRMIAAEQREEGEPRHRAGMTFNQAMAALYDALAEEAAGRAKDMEEGAAEDEPADPLYESEFANAKRQLLRQAVRAAEELAVEWQERFNAFPEEPASPADAAVEAVEEVLVASPKRSRQPKMPAIEEADSETDTEA